MDNQALQAIEYSVISLPEKPLLVPWVTWVSRGDDRLQFRGAEFSFSLSHALFIDTFYKIQPLLDGCHSVGEIASSGGEAILPTTITFLLKMLRANGILQEAHPSYLLSSEISSDEISSEKRQALFLSHILLDSGSGLESLSKVRLGFIGEGSLADEIKISLRSVGITNIFPSNSESLAKDIESEGIEFFIACRESPGFSFFEGVNEKCLAAGIRWMHIAQEGTKALLGPTMVPFQTACYKCYSTRIDALVPDLESHLAFKKAHDQQPRDEGYFPPLGKTVAGQVALEVARIFLGFSLPKTFGCCYEYDVDRMAPIRHDVLRFPRCPACYRKNPPMDIWDAQYPSPVVDEK